jgi:hypothetical protein
MKQAHKSDDYADKHLEAGKMEHSISLPFHYVLDDQRGTMVAPGLREFMPSRYSRNGGNNGATAITP